MYITDAADTDAYPAHSCALQIILFSFALFNLPGGKLETLMVGGSLNRPRIGSRFVLWGKLAIDLVCGL